MIVSKQRPEIGVIQGASGTECSQPSPRRLGEMARFKIAAPGTAGLAVGRQPPAQLPLPAGGDRSMAGGLASR